MTDRHVDDDFMLEMAHRKVGNTAWSALELYALGEQLLTWVTIVNRLGHFSPAGSLDYVHPTGVIWNDYVLDFVAWTAGRENKSPGCEQRLRAHDEESGWRKHKDDQITAAMRAAGVYPYHQTPAESENPRSDSAA